MDFEAFSNAVTMGDRATVEAMLAKKPHFVRAADEHGFTASTGSPVSPSRRSRSC